MITITVTKPDNKQIETIIDELGNENTIEKE